MIADQLLAALTPVGAAADDPAYASRFAALLEASRESGKVPLAAYDIDYMIDLHHQGAYSAIGDEWVSGSILHLTSPNADPDLVERSKRLGVIVYDAVDSTGWALLGKYAGGSAETISRNGLAVEYDIATLLFEMRGMSDHSNEGSVLGARSSGYLIRQTVITLETATRALADGSIDAADTSLWATLPTQEWSPGE